ncbi:hypothetical protein HPC49_12415 [Pyxidicoccus fallax]|uniref:Uncharacterized protein n=1 Tax=Pyxidicoccus fallax TaxID=394095 RepID=A0A848LLV8_9BACT|nr:hypothetical protein [Pyxidicoccus fallax]NMO18633.1 hypothetical protein [Pyxidicoccus fallax]NPC79038.1 hypothetical protein [Pyxidicoccus fallax]
MHGTFEDRLAVSMTLTIGGKAHVIPPGNIRSFALELHGWGLEGRVEFILTDNKALGGKQKDTLLPDFLKPDLAEVSLEVCAVHTDLRPRQKPTPLKLKALVSSKALVELPASSAPDAPLLHRRYTVHFLDAARLLWRQHHPCALYTQKTLQDVLEEHKGEKISLSYDWDAVLGVAHPLLFLGLEREAGASFYDFVLWCLDRHRGVLAYDAEKGSYSLLGAKAEAGTPLELEAREVASLEVLLPEVLRHGATVLNAVAEGPKRQSLTHAQAVAGLRQDVLLCTPLADAVQARVDQEQDRLQARGMELELEWRRMPVEAFAPGALVKLPPGKGWNPASVAAQDTFRVRTLRLSGQARETGPDSNLSAPDAGFHFQMSTRLERQDEPHVDLPAYTPPRYPRHVEGVLVSEVGEEKHETWQVYSEEKTSMDCYRVKLPIWDDQVVSAPFNPSLLPGHFYFPSYKNERVLVALDFQKAWVKRFLDWRAGARLPQESQGVQLLMGKTPTSGATLQQTYEDDKPVLLLRRTNEKDTGVIHLREGALRIQVREEQD